MKSAIIIFGSIAVALLMFSSATATTIEGSIDSEIFDNFNALKEINMDMKDDPDNMQLYHQSIFLLFTIWWFWHFVTSRLMTAGN